MDDKKGLTIVLNDILHIPEKDLCNYKIRLQIKIDSIATEYKTAETVYFHDHESYLGACAYNGKNKQLNRPYVITFAKMDGMEDLWLFTGIFRVLDFNKKEEKNGEIFRNAVLEECEEYKKYEGRLIVHYHKKEQHYILTAESYLDKLKVDQILEDLYDNEHFKGYDKVDLSFSELEHIIKTQKKEWKTALENNKGIYLIRDESNGKKYVGKADGKQMLWQRWKAYAETGHGGNKELKQLSVDYIRKYFRYSILENFVATVSDEVVAEREQWWKKILQTMNTPWGYNDN